MYSFPVQFEVIISLKHNVTIISCDNELQCLVDFPARDPSPHTLMFHCLGNLRDAFEFLEIIIYIYTILKCALQ